MEKKENMSYCKKASRVLHVDTILDVADIMMEHAKAGTECVTVITNLKEIMDAASYLSDEFDVAYGSVDISYGYGCREYALSILSLEDNGGPKYAMYISYAYNDTNKKYSGCDGVVFVDERSAYKVITDIQQNKFIHDFTPVVYSYESEKPYEGIEISKTQENGIVTYKINSVDCVIIEMIDEVIRDFFD